jgi:hypothetical protein
MGDGEEDDNDTAAGEWRLWLSLFAFSSPFDEEVGEVYELMMQGVDPRFICKIVWHNWHRTHRHYEGGNDCKRSVGAFALPSSIIVDHVQG